MAKATSSRPDATRNRETLISAATRAFSGEFEPSMRAIAREAGVGVGTLYRHFPTRELLVEVVYREQLKKLVAGSTDLLEKEKPATAMRKWMDLYREWLVTKHGMSETVKMMLESGEISYTESRATLLNAIQVILDAGAKSGELRSDVSAEDLATGLTGIFMITANNEQSGQTDRLLDLLMDGLISRLR